MCHITKHLGFGAVLGLVLAFPATAAPSPTFEKPRLVIQIKGDQLRGDLPTRYIDRLGEGGLRYLLEDGIHYNNAHHGHANTETIVGHVTLATGAHPAAHGMITPLSPPSAPVQGRLHGPPAKSNFLQSARRI